MARLSLVEQQPSDAAGSRQHPVPCRETRGWERAEGPQPIPTRAAAP